MEVENVNIENSKPISPNFLEYFKIIENKEILNNPKINNEQIEQILLCSLSGNLSNSFNNILSKLSNFEIKKKFK